jgi:hypothetical protein
MSKSPKKLEIRCANTDCGVNLHCYRTSRRHAAQQTALNGSGGLNPATSSEAAQKSAGPVKGRCIACGIELIDWARVHQRNLKDAGHTFDAMRTEWIRHHFWHEPFDELSMNYAKRKGRRGLRKALEKRIRQAVGPAKPFHDGFQTPYGSQPSGRNVLYFTQHATASCCRRCAEEWHNIPLERELTEAEVQYLTELGMRFLDERLPDLADEPVRVPRRAKPAAT